jgi:hypothetical protein
MYLFAFTHSPYFQSVLQEYAEELPQVELNCFTALTSFATDLEALPDNSNAILVDLNSFDLEDAVRSRLLDKHTAPIRIALNCTRTRYTKKQLFEAGFTSVLDVLITKNALYKALFGQHEIPASSSIVQFVQPVTRKRVSLAIYNDNSVVMRKLLNDFKGQHAIIRVSDEDALFDLVEEEQINLVILPPKLSFSECVQIVRTLRYILGVKGTGISEQTRVLLINDSMEQSDIKTLLKIGLNHHAAGMSALSRTKDIVEDISAK